MNKRGKTALICFLCAIIMSCFTGCGSGGNKDPFLQFKGKTYETIVKEYKSKIVRKDGNEIQLRGDFHGAPGIYYVDFFLDEVSDVWFNDVENKYPRGDQKNYYQWNDEKEREILNLYTELYGQPGVNYYEQWGNEWFEYLWYSDSGASITMYKYGEFHEHEEPDYSEDNEFYLICEF